MKMALEASGGMAVQTDSFHNPVFINSLQRVFAKPGEPGHTGVASNAIFEVILQCRAVSAHSPCAPPYADRWHHFPSPSALCCKFDFVRCRSFHQGMSRWRGSWGRRRPSRRRPLQWQTQL